jgi:hypothetical protein
MSGVFVDPGRFSGRILAGTAYKPQSFEQERENPAQQNERGDELY